MNTAKEPSGTVLPSWRSAKPERSTRDWYSRKDDQPHDTMGRLYA